jgi:hypothetical protein
VPVMAQLAAMHTNSAGFSPREAESATSTLSLQSPFFRLPFRNHLLSFARIHSDIEQLILFLGSCANRISSGDPSPTEQTTTDTYLIRAE